jgi:16S rRNA (cytidine1402-2'-O)-methyltransferase
MPGILYLVSTPIGNYDEITLRAVSVLKEVDLIVCENFVKQTGLLAHLQIQKKLTINLMNIPKKKSPCNAPPFTRRKKLIALNLLIANSGLLRSRT